MAFRYCRLYGSAQVLKGACEVLAGPASERDSAPCHRRPLAAPRALLAALTAQPFTLMDRDGRAACRHAADAMR
jgi:hypothetical protein